MILISKFSFLYYIWIKYLLGTFSKIECKLVWFELKSELLSKFKWMMIQRQNIVGEAEWKRRVVWRVETGGRGGEEGATPPPLKVSRSAKIGFMSTSHITCASSTLQS